MNFIFELLQSAWIVYIALFFLVLGGTMASADSDRRTFNTWALIDNVLILSLLGFHFGLKWTNSWSYFAIAVVAYLVIGVMWSTFKWMRYCIKARDAFLREAQRWCNSKNVYLQDIKANVWPVSVKRYQSTPETEDAKLSFRSRVLDNPNVMLFGTYPNDGDLNPWAAVVKCVTPDPAWRKGLIIEWMITWPTSVISYAVRDLVREVFDRLYAAIRRAFLRISNRIFSGV